MSTPKNERKWTPWENAYRVVGEGALGIYQGSHVWTQDAADARRSLVLAFGVVSRAWTETYTDGTWKRVGEAYKADDKAPTKPLWWEQFYT